MQLVLLFSVLVFLVNYFAAHDDCSQDPQYCENDEERERHHGPRCSNCVQINNYQSPCISGEMLVEEQIKGHISVSQLSVGDVIRGITGANRTPGWCKVEAVFPVPQSENQTTYDGFTKTHMVVDSTVHPYGKKGKVRKGLVFTLATECDAAVNAAGQAFSPISTAFCPHDLSWTDYLTLIAAVRSVTNRAGNFWFDLKSYHDNETAVIPHWLDQLPAICRELLRCARNRQCQEFENVVNVFVHQYVNKKYAEVVKRVFPNLGGDVDKEQAGTITEVVRPQRSSHIALFSALGSAIAVLLIVAVAVLVYRGRIVKKKALKMLEPKKTGDGLA